jgi:signal transduction histidine kinase
VGGTPSYWTPVLSSRLTAASSRQRSLAFCNGSAKDLRGCTRLTAIPEFSFAYQVDPEPAQVGHAREQVRKILPGWGLAEHDDLLELIVSELVTNALPNCDGPIEIRLSYDGYDLRVEVRDACDEMPVRRDPAHDDEHGRGLQLVDGLIESYGGTRGITKQSACPGKVVYVVLPLRPGEPAGSSTGA